MRAERSGSSKHVLYLLFDVLNAVHLDLNVNVNHGCFWQGHVLMFVCFFTGVALGGGTRIGHSL